MHQATRDSREFLTVAQTLTFTGRLASPSPRRQKRHLSDKFQEIALRSPKDMAALETLADRVLARLDQEDRDRLS